MFACITENLSFVSLSLRRPNFGFFSDFDFERRSLLIFEFRPLLLTIPTFNQDTAAISAGQRYL